MVKLYSASFEEYLEFGPTISRMKLKISTSYAAFKDESDPPVSLRYGTIKFKPDSLSFHSMKVVSALPNGLKHQTFAILYAQKHFFHIQFMHIKT